MITSPSKEVSSGHSQGVVLGEEVLIDGITFVPLG